MPQLPGSTLIDSAAFAATVSYLLSLFKPLIERLPWAHPDSALHDTTIRLANLVLNELMTLAAYAIAGPLLWQNAWLYAFQGIAQAIASDHLYTVLTNSSSGSAGNKSLVSVPPTGVSVPPTPLAEPSNDVEGQTLTLTPS